MSSLSATIQDVFNEPGCGKNANKSEAERKKGCTKQLQPGGAAVFVLVTQSTPDKVLPRISQYGGEVIHSSLSEHAEEIGVGRGRGSTCNVPLAAGLVLLAAAGFLLWIAVLRYLRS